MKTTFELQSCVLLPAGPFTFLPLRCRAEDVDGSGAAVLAAPPAGETVLKQATGMDDRERE